MGTAPLGPTLGTHCPQGWLCLVTVHEPDPGSALTLAASLDPCPKLFLSEPFQEVSRPRGHRAPSCLGSHREGLSLSGSRKPPRAEDGPQGFWEACEGPRPAVLLYKAPGALPQPSTSASLLPELRSASTAAAMKCLLLALSVALVCGTQAKFISRITPEDFHVQKVWGAGALQRGVLGVDDELQADGKLGPQNPEEAVVSGVCVRSPGWP